MSYRLPATSYQQVHTDAPLPPPQGVSLYWLWRLVGRVGRVVTSGRVHRVGFDVFRCCWVSSVGPDSGSVSDPGVGSGRRCSLRRFPARLISFHSALHAANPRLEKRLVLRCVLT